MPLIGIGRLHHTTHTWVTGWHWWFWSWLVGNDTLGGEEHACYGSGLLKSYTSYLGWVDDTSLVEVLILLGASIVTEVLLAVLDALYNHSIDEIGSDEIQQALLDVVQEQLSLPENNATLLAAKRLGFARRGPHVEAALQRALRHLITNGRIVSKDGKLTIGG
jgi:hypothetical protein